MSNTTHTGSPKMPDNVICDDHAWAWVDDDRMVCDDCGVEKLEQWNADMGVYESTAIWEAP